jgi:hypothetical protein
VPNKLRTKLGDKAERGVMVGYPASSKGYRILLNDGRIEVSRDIIFDEGFIMGPSATITDTP